MRSARPTASGGCGSTGSRAMSVMLAGKRSEPWHPIPRRANSLRSSFGRSGPFARTSPKGIAAPPGGIERGSSSTLLVQLESRASGTTRPAPFSARPSLKQEPQPSRRSHGSFSLSFRVSAQDKSLGFGRIRVSEAGGHDRDPLLTPVAQAVACAVARAKYGPSTCVVAVRSPCAVSSALRLRSPQCAVRAQ